jgi:adenylylsulfate kinase-like enzyme
MSFRILIMGLSGAGKTTLAEKIVKGLRSHSIHVTWLNADDIRSLTNNWDFSDEGRILQAHTLRRMADAAPTPVVIADFIAPLAQQRSIFDADFTVWVDTVIESKYKDTDTVFDPPSFCNYYISDYDDQHEVNILHLLLDNE